MYLPGAAAAGAAEVRLRAVAYDSADLGSNPTEILLKHSGVRPVPGNLYVLSVGLSRYKNGRDESVARQAGQFSNLKFPAVDARAMAERLQQEGKPLYDTVQVRTLTDTDEEATLTNLHAGLQWLQQSARPGQVDTVVICLSGHGVSDPQGCYYFPAYEFDPAQLPGTSLSGRELQQALGGKLRARSVFLFVDT